jgi:transglutaminase-like putative cysteine protease
MRLDTVFRISVYLTLVLASACLAFTEEPYLAGMVYFLAVVLLLLAVAFVMDGRWELTLTASNVLGLIIAGASGVWIVVSLVAPSNPWIESAPYPIALLPFGGPVLMLVLLAKLFRPKQTADYWWLYLIGLMEVALGCILANDLAFSLWLFAYLSCGLWSLTLFALHRDQQQALVVARSIGPSDVQRSDGSDHYQCSLSDVTRPDKSGHYEPLPWRGWGLRGTVGRAVVVIGLGLVLFLLTPRFGNRNWNLLNPAQTRGQMEMGYSPTMDLTQTGEVKVSDEEAFQVKVENADGQPKLDLSPQQRWRGTTLDLYENGRWGGRRRAYVVPWGRRHVYPPIPEGGRDDLPTVGVKSFFVTFNVDYRRARGLMLAEPVAPPHAGDVPVRTLDQYDRWAPHFRERDSCLGTPPDRYPQAYRYLQVVPEDNRPPSVAPLSPDDLSRFLYQPIPGVARWTGELLPHLVASGQLTEAELAFVPDPTQGDGRYLLPQNRAKVARALTDYFVLSGAFVYRLEMQRVDQKLDPIEDFLRNTRAGFCEHYATALTMVLRSVGIPARVVVGYRGAEAQGDTPGTEGTYVIRQSDAHSWVEALLPRRGPAGLEVYWQTLDPTPAQDPRTQTAAYWARWWRSSRLKIRDLWKNLVVDYNVDRQQDALALARKYLGLEEGWDSLEALGTWFQEEVLTGRLLGRRWPWLVVPPLFPFGWWALRRRRIPSQPGPMAFPAGDVAFYRHWLTLVSRYCRLERRPTQTPREFSDSVRQALARFRGTAAVADLSRRVVDLYYRVRFGNEPIAPAENSAIEREVAELESHLAANHGGARPPNTSV